MVRNGMLLDILKVLVPQKNDCCVIKTSVEKMWGTFSSHDAHVTYYSTRNVLAELPATVNPRCLGSTTSLGDQH